MRRSIGRRGAYFFVLDAFIAGMVIVASLAVILAAFNYKESSTQSYYLAEDFASFLEQTQIKRYAGETVYNMTKTGVISNKENTLMEQTVMFYHTGSAQSFANLSLMLAEVSNLAPENSGLLYYIIDPNSPDEAKLVYGTKAETDSNSARVKLSAQRIITIFDNREIIGPYIVEVRLWR